MKLTIADVVRVLEEWAPPAYQESYDNAGLIVGSPQTALRGVLLALDAVESVIDEAIATGCNLVVAHHPIVFGGLKKITGRNYVERTVIKAIKHDVAIYAIHTNLDHVASGVNAKIGQRLGLQHLRILSPKRGLLKKLTVFVPLAHTETLLSALSAAGAGNIGNYSECSFTLVGEGTFKPNAQANPHIGQAGQLERVQETRIEVIFPGHLEGKVLAAMRAAHPYEEVAYYVNALENEHQEVGAGMVGQLPQPMPEADFLAHLKQAFGLACIRHTPLRGKPVQTVAVCGGAGSFLLGQALAARADVFVTADYKYHQFFDAEGKIIIADIGHYESEVFTKQLLYEKLSPVFGKALLKISETNTNPVQYFC